MTEPIRIVVIQKRYSLLKPRLVERENPCIPENGEIEFDNNQVEETIQMRYDENKNMLTERLGEKHHGIENIPETEAKKVLEILFKFNSLAAVSGHSEKDLLERRSSQKKR
jgi:hypothetical protein